MNKYEDTTVKGLYYIPDYLTDQEIADIMNLLKTNKEWKTVGKSTSSRRVIHYGYSYSYDRSGISKVTEIPENLKKLVSSERINKYFDTNSGFLLKNEMDQLIINEYKPGQGIFAHIDHVKYFGDVIVCLNLGSAIGIDFTKDNKKKSIYVKPKSLYIMSGSARYEWRHGIAASMYDVGTKRGIRWSLTYRTINNDVLEKDEE